MNDISLSTHHSQLLKFADDTKCYKHILDYSDQDAFQDDINALAAWSNTSQLKFNLTKSVHLSFKYKFATSYHMFDSPISHTNSHKDLGLMMSEDLKWDKHYSHITARAYRVLGLIRCTFGSTHCISVMVKLYVSLVRSQLYCIVLNYGVLSYLKTSSSLREFSVVQPNNIIF